MKRFSLYLSLITILGAIPRIILLMRRGSFWFDELFTLELAKLPFGEMLALATRDTNPPLWTIIMWPWAHLLPHDEWIVRILALVLGTLLIPLIGLLGRACGRDRAGLIAALFVAISPPLIYFSTEARMYALFTILTVAVALTATHVIKNPSRAALAIYTVTSTFLAASHLYAIIPLATQYLTGLMLLPQKTKKTWHILHGGLILAVAAWFFFSYYAKLPDLVGNSWFTRVIPGIGWPFSIFSSLFVLPGTLHTLLFFAITAITLTLILIGIAFVFKRNEQHLISSIMLMLLGLALASLIGPAKIKYFIFILPATAFLIAWMLAETPMRWRHVTFVIVTIAAIASTTLFIRTFRFSWDRVARVATEESGIAIIIPWAVNYLPFSYYYHGENPVGVIRSPGMDVVTISTLLASNWKWELPQEHIEKELARIVPEDGALLVVQSDPYVFGVQEWLEAHGWRRDEPQTFEAKNSFDALHSVRVERYKK